MSILTDKEIRALCIDVPADKAMIAPFEGRQVKTADGKGMLSYGLSSMGYDVRLASDELKLFTNAYGAEIDPLNLDVERCFVTPELKICQRTGFKYVTVPPNSYLLGKTMEYFKIPRDIMVICLGKSTTARAATHVNVTPIEADFEGIVVVEIANASSLPLRVYVEMGVAQFLFFRASEECETSYADRGGKYQKQSVLTHAKV